MKGLSPPVKYFLSVPRRYFFCGSFVLFMTCVCCACASVHCCLVVAWGKGLASWHVFVIFIVMLLVSHLVSWDRCGT